MNKVEILLKLMNDTKKEGRVFVNITNDGSPAVSYQITPENEGYFKLAITQVIDILLNKNRFSSGLDYTISVTIQKVFQGFINLVIDSMVNKQYAVKKNLKKTMRPPL